MALSKILIDFWWLIHQLGIALQNSKYKKTHQQQFFSIFFLSWFETDLLEKQSLLKFKKITNEQQLKK
jgi:hypothetical protein